VDLRALRRLASICFWLVMASNPLSVGGLRGHSSGTQRLGGTNVSPRCGKPGPREPAGIGLPDNFSIAPQRGKSRMFAPY